MEQLVLKLKEALFLNHPQIHFATDNMLDSFEKQHHVLIPEDMKLYFKLINGIPDSNYDDFFFSFYPIYEFKNIDEAFKYRNGVPNYTNLVNTLYNPNSCFVFCDYEFHLFSYAIRLYENKTMENEIYSICGDKYRIIANSFSDFLKLYFNQSETLQF